MLMFSFFSQKKSIAPHLDIYSSEFAATSSILHRITGFVVALPALVLFFWEPSFIFPLEEQFAQVSDDILAWMFERRVYVPGFPCLYCRPIPGVFGDPALEMVWPYTLLVLYYIGVCIFFFFVYHSLHGIQHWAWDDLVRDSGFRSDEKSFFLGRFYKFLPLWLTFGMYSFA